MKTYYLILSQEFPASHPKAGAPTYFITRLLRKNKLHTIRGNYDLWEKRFKKIAEGKACLSVRVWVGKPYGKGSTQQEIVRLTREDGIGLQKLSLNLIPDYRVQAVVDSDSFAPDNYRTFVECDVLAYNDGLSLENWWDWFKGCDLTQPFAIIQFSSYRY